MSINVRMNSPTQVFKEHVLSALYNGTGLNKITKVSFIDIDGDEADYTTDLVFNIVDRLYIMCSITATFDYRVSKIRVYSYGNIYFEHEITFYVVEGKTYNITIEISISLNSSYLRIYDKNLTRYIYEVLANMRQSSDLNVSSVVFNVLNLDANEYYTIPVTPVKFLNEVLEIQAEISLSYGWALDYITIRGSNDLYFYVTTRTGEPATIIFKDRINV